MWAAIAVAIAVIPVDGVFTRTRLFFIRDLTMAFRPRFLFLRHAFASGTFPLWDPYTGHGQAAINDALYQLFHLPSLPIRLWLPEVEAYNIWIALPVPLAALGMYLFLRRQVKPPAAALGAIAFALAGPIVSSTNFPNMSWSICAVPFVFWSLERLFERRTLASAAVLAVMVALQALAGEPVSLATTLAIAIGYATIPTPRRRDWRVALLTLYGIGMGCLLAAIQYVPLGLATRASARGQMVDTDFWTFHPLALIELLVPHFFGDYFNSNLRELAWMIALNSGRDPFYYTMYIGVPIALLAGVAMASRRPATHFWTAVVLLCAVASLGAHTPVYPVMQAIVPIIKSFRFPVKYLSLASFGLATLAAMAFEWLIDADVPKRPVRIVLMLAGALALATYVVVAWVLIAPALPIRAFFQLAVWAKVPAPIQGAEFLLYRARPLLSSLFLKLISTAFLLWVAASARRERRLALGVLSVFIVVDLIASNSSVNPTADPKLLAMPEWLQHVPQDMHERVYIGGRPEGYVNTSDEDAPKYARSLDEYPEMEQRYIVVSEYLFQPSAARVRESMSYDLLVLWPIEFARAHSLFTISSRAARLRWLERVGTRYALLPVPPFPGAQPLAEMVSTPQMHLYEFAPDARRAIVVPDALIGPSTDWQIQGMFLQRFHPSDGVLVSEAPPPATGFPGAPVPAAANFVEDGLNRVVIQAGLPKDGYLVLFDTYHPDWKVDVDGAPAPLIRGDGLFRAVHIARGTHTVTFTYRPRALYLGAALSALAALVLVATSFIRARVGSVRRHPLLFLIALSLVPVRGVFTASRIFYVRDLSFFFWSRHLWLRHTIFAGHAPWWDPFVAGGQSAIADALNQIAMPVTLAIRLLPSDLVSFNLWIALPLPIAMAGMFVFLRRHVAQTVGSAGEAGLEARATYDGAAAIGAIAFALSGPVVSMLNVPNLAWSVALLPWVMAAEGRWLALAFALQALCGEPVTWAATGVLVLAFRPRVATIAALTGGALLAALQLVPTFLAGVRAHRAALATPDFWSLHPLWLWEAIAPQLFGNYYDAFLADLPWMGALNFGRDPFFYSMYVGPLVLLLGAVALTERPRRWVLWLAVLIAFTIAALGGYTPLYPLLRRLVPPLMYFRFPVKYIVFAVFALAVLAAQGWTAVADGLSHRRYGAAVVALIAGGVGLLAGIYMALSPAIASRASYALALSAHLKDPAAGAAFLARVAPPLVIRACALLLAGGVLVMLAARHRTATMLLAAALCADLLITNDGLNVTTELTTLTPPQWFTAAAGEQRLYIGGRVRGYMNASDPDAVSTWQIPAESTAVEGRMELNALLPMAPSGWGVREALSYDLPYLWPAQYEATVQRFERATTAERDAFLRRSGVRWCVVPAAQHRDWRAIADVENWNMRVYDCHPDATRAYIASTAAVGGSASDDVWQRAALFDPAQPDDAVRLAAMPAPAGRAGPAGSPSMGFVKDDPNHVILEVTLMQPSVVVLRDTFDPSWTATVDGLPATVARANGIYRAVAIPAGRHTVEFSYRPRDFEIGLIVTVLAGLTLAFIKR